ncbi:SpoIIE family protein phosphatase [Lentzea sp. NPDC060358]|uniref:SpoIIE family protein phosphatase n=1 Tax=Lentzea sp. NPDC060358 TaxID=3347103 RepID=UPI0036514C49
MDDISVCWERARMTSEHGDRDLSRDRLVGDPHLVRRVFDQLPLLVLVLQGAELRVVATTEAYRSYARRTEMIGTPIREVFADLDQQHIVQLFERAYTTGEPVEVRELRAYVEVPDVGLVDYLVDFTATPWRDDDGEIAGVTITATDVTGRVREREAAQERTAAAERRYAAARDVIDALQRELLPAGVPVLPGVQLAASYLLADADTAAGGDWFDSVVLADGRVGLVVGDVVGHGVAASAAMGQLRVLLTEYLAATGDIVAALRAADVATDRIHGARAATVCVVVLDTVTGVVEYCTAGHPPPLVVPVGDQARYLPPTGTAPLGVGAERGPAVVRTDRLGRGDLVLLYSDGVLERPGRSLAESTVELAQVAADATADRIMRGGSALAVERACTQTVEVLTRATGHSDDITLLAAQLTAAPAALDVVLTADEQALRTARVTLDDWLAGIPAGADDRDAVRHAVVELITNATEHAYVDSAGQHTCTLTASLAGNGSLSVRVTDRGRWRSPAPSTDRGLGLQMVEHLMDSLRIDHDEHGTTAETVRRLTRPAKLITAGNGASGTAGKRAQSDPLLVLDQPSAPTPRIRLDGPVDAATTSVVNKEILTAGSTGARSLTVDLTGVTHLASSGVAALHRLVALHRANGTELRLLAPPGSNAGMVLSLVELDHHTADPDYPEVD